MTGRVIGSQAYDDDLQPGDVLAKTAVFPVPYGLAGGQYYVQASVETAADANPGNNLALSADTDWFGLIDPGSDETPPNNDYLAATDLGTINGTLTRSGRRLHNRADVDWYRFNLLNEGQPGDKVRIDFQDVQGDLDLYVSQDNITSPPGAPILWSEVRGSNGEEVSLSSAARRPLPGPSRRLRGRREPELRPDRPRHAPGRSLRAQRQL